MYVSISNAILHTRSHQIVTFVRVGEPGDNESTRVVEAGEATVDSEENGTDGAVDAVDEDHIPESHPQSHNVSVAAPSFHHTPATSHCTPQGRNSSVYGTNQSEPEPLEKVLASYLLRHFKQEPGHWCVLMSFLNFSGC